ncbi:PAS domain-containing protein, partial [Salmonella enterica]|nr:PAS domain-containing protein [Salmonella enterica]
MTASKLESAETGAKLAAIGRSQAVIEFTASGEILTANENFLSTVGYGLDEIRGQHHRMFVDPALAQSPDYAAFWGRLGRGEFVTAEFRRVGKGGREIWLQASYNPIFDLDGRVTKVVKFASDVTERVAAVNEIADALHHLSDNDLEIRIDRPLTPAFERLRVDFNGSIDR